MSEHLVILWAGLKAVVTLIGLPFLGICIVIGWLGANANWEKVGGWRRKVLIVSNVLMPTLMLLGLAYSVGTKVVKERPPEAAAVGGCAKD